MGIGEVLGGISSAVGLVSGISGMDSGGGTQQGNVAGGAYYDPYASSRPQAASWLNALLYPGAGSPMDMITRMPGYQFGMQQGTEALQRQLAASGQTQSGAQQIALSQFGQGYAGQQYDKMINTLAQLSGATQSPLSMSAANQLGASQQQAGWQSIGQGLGGLSNVLGGVGSVFPSGGGVSPGVFGGGMSDPFGGYNIGGVYG